MEELSSWVDVKRRSLFVVKWATADEGRACSLDREISADDIYDIRRVEHSFDSFLRYNCHEISERGRLSNVKCADERQ